MTPSKNEQPSIGIDSNTEHEADANADGGSGGDERTPTRPVSVEAIVREYAPANQPWPALPDGFSEDGWEFRTVSHRTCPSRTGQTALCPTTGEQLPVTEPHICITARRDQHPGTPGPTAEYRHFAFENPDQLREWFEHRT